MISEKTYSFLIKFLVIVILFVGISLLIQSIINPEIEEHNSLPFFEVSDSLTDSLITNLSLDEKLDLIFQANNPGDSIVRNDSVPLISFGGKGSTSEVVSDYAKNNRIKLNVIKGHNYLAGISDSSFFRSYVQNETKLTYNQLNSYTYLPFTEDNWQNISDSVYMQLLEHRINLLSGIYRKSNKLFGVKLRYQHFVMLDSLKADSLSQISNFYELLKSKIDWVYLDSVQTDNLIPFYFSGLLVARLNSKLLPNENELVKILNSKIDIYYLDKSQIQEFKTSTKKLLQDGKINELSLNDKLQKILKVRHWTTNKVLETDSISSNDAAKLFDYQLVEKSVCLLNNPDQLIPVKRIHNKRFYIVWIGGRINTTFLNYTKKYVNAFAIHLKPGENNWNKKLGSLSKRSFMIYVLDTVIADSADVKQLAGINQTMKKAGTVVVNFRNYKNLNYVADSIACLQLQGQSKMDYQYAAQAIWGGIAIEGRMPYYVNDYYTFGIQNISSKTRLKYSIAEDAGVDAEKLKIIDQIAREGIARGAFPGCQVFIAKDGKVIYDKSFGYHTYSRKNRVKHEDVYDIASVTKIAATTIAAMEMVGGPKMSLNDRLNKFFKNTKIDYTRIKPDTLIQVDTFFNASIKDWETFLKQNDTINISDTSFTTTNTIITRLTPYRNIFKVPIIDLLKHKSGIVPATPIFRYIYYKAYFIKNLKNQLTALHGKSGSIFNYKSFDLPATFPDNTGLDDSLKQLIKDGFKKQYDAYFSKSYVKDTSDIRLTDNLYLKNEYFDTIWRDFKQMPVFSRKVFIYSDVNMILLQLAIDSLNKKPIDTYLKKTFYKPLGLKTITYLPRKYYSKQKIVPTEMDNSWRYGNLHGYVHDPSAALMGGMVGNAGLYSNAHDLGVLFQMVLNNGMYGGTRFLRSTIIERFTKRNDDTQRGLGFDMPNRKARVGKKASNNTYGHSGYTGTCVWVDPDSQLVYVFLSNRNHTSSKNWRITKYAIRERIHDAIYDAMFKKDIAEKDK